ncbi:hypothetical protein NQ315_017130 [Exocentrus adspersus]|uniref:Uncharacterized protein n=1 Tax=Exocentrus adspersus TaxID=1586481 RepID=A0AAV8VBH4_9CUCU|nr:hypothetical protein NQ315_017130 [Exocentrus adspersus]
MLVTGYVAYPTIIGLCLGGVLFGLIMVAVTWWCYRRRLAISLKQRHGPDQPLAFHTHRRPTAVKSPAGSGTGTHYLKKSPSPTGTAKTPPGFCIFCRPETEICIIPLSISIAIIIRFLTDLLRLACLCRGFTLRLRRGRCGPLTESSGGGSGELRSKTEVTGVLPSIEACNQNSDALVSNGLVWFADKSLRHLRALGLGSVAPSPWQPWSFPSTGGTQLRPGQACFGFPS